MYYHWRLQINLFNYCGYNKNVLFSSYTKLRQVSVPFVMGGSSVALRIAHYINICPSYIILSRNTISGEPVQYIVQYVAGAKMVLSFFNDTNYNFY